MKGGQERRRGHRNGGIWFQTMVLGAERTGPLDADLDTDLSPDTRPGPSTAPAASAADEPVRPFVRRGSQAPPAVAETAVVVKKIRAARKRLGALATVPGTTF